MFAQDVRIVTGGVAFYALFSVFPLIYLTLTMAGLFLPEEIAARLTQPVGKLFTSGIQNMSDADFQEIRGHTPQGITIRALIAIMLVLFAASAGSKAVITGIRMIAGTSKSSGLFRFNGFSIVLVGTLILAVWLLGAAQLLVTAATQDEAGFITRMTADIVEWARTWWITRWVAAFVVFYVIIGLSLRGQVKGGRAKLAGAASGALGWLIVTGAFQLYLNFTVLDTLYGALASVILGFFWLTLSVSCLLFGAALATEWAKVWGEDDVPEI